ncbi:hypothetical protein ACOBQX_09165 [Actinokineospora sp. G85]|uniref:hypothetical protein n=1 Tax=Actinokineospora sp. G85 TaxID=3406626 RepID=UPI003C77DB62
MSRGQQKPGQMSTVVRKSLVSSAAALAIAALGAAASATGSPVAADPSDTHWSTPASARCDTHWFC